MPRSTVCAMLLSAVFASGAFDQTDTSVATSLATAPGQVRTVLAAASTTYYYDYWLVPDRSYAALCWNEDVRAALGGGVLIRCTASIADSLDVTVPGLTSGFFMEPIAIGGSWAAFTATLSSREYVVKAAVSLASAGTVRIALVETTLFSPWYFVNAVGGYDSFVEIKNTTQNAVTVRVKAFSPAGLWVGSSVDRTIPANGNTLVLVGTDIAVPGSGGLQITHNGAPGSIVANVTTLSGITGLSFDAPFQPRTTGLTFQ